MRLARVDRTRKRRESSDHAQFQDGRKWTCSEMDIALPPKLPEPKKAVNHTPPWRQLRRIDTIFPQFREGRPATKGKTHRHYRRPQRLRSWRFKPA